MTTHRQAAANRRNAQFSTGPRDTARSRLNSLLHGIFAKEALIQGGEGKEDAALFDTLSAALREDLAPDGALEELLVDELSMLTWRRRRVLRHETASIRLHLDTAGEDWEAHQERWPSPSSDTLRSKGHWQTTERLTTRATLLQCEVAVLASDDPLGYSPLPWQRVFAVAEAQFRVPVRKILALKSPWQDYAEYSRDQVERVVRDACERVGMAEADFWATVRVDAERDEQDARLALTQRQDALEQRRSLASLPDEKTLERVQRYEAHLTRQFSRVLHELQRLQAARMGGPSPLPLAVDVEVSSPGSDNTISPG